MNDHPNDLYRRLITDENNQVHDRQSDDSLSYRVCAVRVTRELRYTIENYLKL